MKKSNLLNSLILAALVVPGVAMAEDASPHTFTGNVGFTTDYTFRGISQNYRSPAVQGGFDYAHSSGFYAGTWASNVSGNQYTNTSMEWDWYAGYNGKVNDDLAYNVGLVSVV
ncbi:MAG: TorF family putative porin, partial [Gallionella sp.]